MYSDKTGPLLSYISLLSVTARQTGKSYSYTHYMIRAYGYVFEFLDLVKQSNETLFVYKDVLAIYKELERLQYVRKMTFHRPFFINRKKVRKWLKVNQNRYLIPKTKLRPMGLDEVLGYTYERHEPVTLNYSALMASKKKYKTCIRYEVTKN